MCGHWLSRNQMWELPSGESPEGGVRLGVFCEEDGSVYGVTTTTTTCWQQPVALREGGLV